MTKLPIIVSLTPDGDVEIKNVPAGIEIVLDDQQDGGYTVFGAGDNNILTQKL
jgi:hypothetical protein